MRYKFYKFMDKLFSWPTNLYKTVPNPQKPIRLWIWGICMRGQMKWGYKAWCWEKIHGNDIRKTY